LVSTLRQPPHHDYRERTQLAHEDTGGKALYQAAAHTTAGVELRHGYTLAELNDLAVRAARRGRFNQSSNLGDRVNAAWSAMAEHLYSSPTAPEVGDLIYVGWHAIGQMAHKDWQFIGRDTHDRYAGTRHNFVRYWWTEASPTSGHEERLIDRVALWQIWDRMRPVHKEVLSALSVHEDYRRAAEALGKSPKTFAAQVAQARAAFLLLWHEGEAPSRPWGIDRRKSATSTDRHSTTYVIRRRERSRAKNGKPKPRGATRPNRLDAAGVSPEQVAARYTAGESIRQLAAAFGVGYSSMQRWMAQNAIERRSMGGTFKDDGGRIDLGISVEELAERYHGGQTLREIAADLKVDRKTVSSTMRRNGIERRPAGRRSKSEAPRSTQPREK
jgi:uncharacterized protein (DUF433 family)